MVSVALLEKELQGNYDRRKKEKVLGDKLP